MINGKNRIAHRGFLRNVGIRLNKLKVLSKRERLIISVIFLSLGLFITEYFLGKSALYTILGLSIVTDILLFLSLREDLKDNFWPQIFILPFFYSLAFGLFYFLVPARLLTRIAMTSLYALGLYSLFLSENIFYRFGCPDNCTFIKCENSCLYSNSFVLLFSCKCYFYFPYKRYPNASFYFWLQFSSGIKLRLDLFA